MAMVSECSDMSCFSPQEVGHGGLAGISLFKSSDNCLSIPALIEMAILCLGVGGLSSREYLELKLFDNRIYGGVDKKAFVGEAASREIWFRANYRVDLFAIAQNKIASATWFAAHGLPTLPTIALFHEDVGRPGTRLLRSEPDLRSFLRDGQNYPFFGKPIEGLRSIGSASVESYVPSRDCLVTTAGQIVSLDNFVSYVKSHAKSGYQFQPRVSPHADVGELCGNRLATIRLLTLSSGGEPKIARACWKIPAGMHAADNFWRPGNLLCQLDLESGRILRAIRENGASYEEVSHHPDSGKPLVGTTVPNWGDVTRLALDGARLLQDLPLIGWDIAPVDSGAVIVEANLTPDFRLHQLADRRGVLDKELASFLQERKLEIAKFLRAGKPSDLWSRVRSLRLWLQNL